jgi:3-phenylpropionate/cinnamic acid dioxygenase small subunit
MPGDLQREVEQFLYAEARMLDERRYDDWLNLFTNDCRYWVPVMSTRERGNAAAEISGNADLAHFDDTKGTLTLRIKRLATNFAYAEDPPSRTVRVVTNIQAEPAGGNDEVKAFSNLILYRTRLETTTDIFAARREDILRRTGSGWNIASRKAVLAVNVLPSNNLSVFF